MNILFYLEPTTEHNNPFFRYATLRNSLVPQAKALKEDQTVLLCSTQIAERAICDNYSDSFSEIVAVDEMEWSGGEDGFSRLMRLQNKQYKLGEIANIKSVLDLIMPQNFIPDVIISWESPVYFFEEIYPTAKILYQMPGFFSRPPYANLIAMDSGLLDKSHHFSLSYNNFECNNKLFETIRSKDIHLLDKACPINNLIHIAYSKFSKVILLPLQVDNYFMVNNVLISQGYSNQLEFLISILDKIPRNIGVWVTNYKSRDIRTNILSKDVIVSLRNKFSHFLYFDECDNVANVSQFLVPKLDGVITISSSVGFQTAYYQKPLFCLGKSHVSIFSTSENFEIFVQQIYDSSKGVVINRDEVIFKVIQHQHIPVGFVTSRKFRKWLLQYIQKQEFTKWTEDLPVTLDTLRREKGIIEEMVNNKNKPSFDYCIELAEQIKKHDIISFDIFDTLLMRPFAEPRDLFKLFNNDAQQIVQDNTFNFYLARKESEKKAFEMAIASGIGETTIQSIYEVLAKDFNIPVRLSHKLMDFEMQVEKQLLYRRETAYNAFQQAKKMGKKIIIISDMYLPAEFLEEVLTKNGYYGYDRIYVSSQYKEKKHSGKLFDIVLNDFSNVPAHKILHVGDNLRGDVENPKKKGMHAFHLPKALDVFKEHDDYRKIWLRDEINHSLDWKSVLSVIGQKFNDNSYLPYRKGTIFGGDPWRLGFYGFAPLLLGFVKWLIENAQSHHIDTLYFLSRDGKIMKEAYDIVAQYYPSAPKSEYLLCSRRAVNVAKIRTLNDILDLLYVDFAHDMNLGSLLENRFGVQFTDINPDVLSKHGFSWSGNANSKINKNDLPRLRLLFTELQDIIINIATKERDNYLLYLDEVGIFHPDNNNAIVDIGYAGTMQESLFLLSNKSKKLSGYYLMTFRQALHRLKKNGLESFGYLANFVDRHDTYHPFCKHVPLYETLFSASDSSFVKMITNWNKKLIPVFLDMDKEEYKRNLFVQRCHAGALDFIKLFSDIFMQNINKIDIEPNKSLRTLNAFFSTPHPRDAQIFSGICFEDNYGGRGKVFILPDDVRSSQKYIWKEGFHAIEEELKNSGKVNKGSGNSVANTIQGTRSTVSTVNNRTSKFIFHMLSPFLNDRKKSKLRNNPKLFFYDSKSKFIKLIGRFYV